MKGSTPFEEPKKRLERRGSADWVDCQQERPAEYEKVLMWYSTDNGWAVVDCWHNRVIRKPNYWARLNPPNDPSSAT